MKRGRIDMPRRKARAVSLLLAGLLAGSALRLSDGLTLLFALAGLALGALAARGIDLRLRAKPQWRPSVINVYPAGAVNEERKS